jgi:hypothetical protein
MLKAGIIDPTKVVRLALQDAAFRVDDQQHARAAMLRGVEDACLNRSAADSEMIRPLIPR